MLLWVWNDPALLTWGVLSDGFPFWTRFGRCMSLIVKDANRRIELDRRIKTISEPALNQEFLCPPRYRRILAPHPTLGPESSTCQAGYSRLHLFPTRAHLTVNAKKRECFAGGCCMGYCGEQGAVLSPMVATGQTCKCNANPLPDREGVCATVDGHAERCGGTMGALDIQG